MHLRFNREHRVHLVNGYFKSHLFFVFALLVQVEFERWEGFIGSIVGDSGTVTPGASTCGEDARLTERCVCSSATGSVCCADSSRMSQFVCLAIQLGSGFEIPRRHFSNLQCDLDRKSPRLCPQVALSTWPLFSRRFPDRIPVPGGRNWYTYLSDRRGLESIVPLFPGSDCMASLSGGVVFLLLRCAQTMA